MRVRPSGACLSIVPCELTRRSTLLLAPGVTAILQHKALWFMQERTSLQSQHTRLHDTPTTIGFSTLTMDNMDEYRRIWFEQAKSHGESRSCLVCQTST